MSNIWLPGDSDFARAMRGWPTSPVESPIVAAEIDTENSITKDLTVAIVGHQAVAERNPIFASAGRSFAASDRGPVLSADGSKAAFSCDSLDRIGYGDGKFSFFGVFRGHQFYNFAPLYVSDSTGNPLFIGVRSGNLFVVRNGGINYLSSALPISVGVWYSFAVTHNSAASQSSARMRLYINGQLEDNDSWLCNDTTWADQRLLDGNDSTWDKPDADLQHFVFLQRELSADEVYQLHKSSMQLYRPANDTPFLISVPAGGGVTGTGDIVGAGSEIVGTGTRTVTGTGALEGQGAAIVGTGERVITGTGALIGQGSDVAGTGATGSVHTGTGDLVGAGSEIVGVGERTITGSGALVAQGSAVVGVGERTVIGSGDLVGAGAEVSGSGAVGGITTGTGDLVGAGSNVVGTGIRTVTGSGALVAQGSAVTGTGERVITGAGALVGSGSEIVGTGVGGDVTTGAGALVGQGSAVTGTGTRTITGVGELVAAGSIIVGAGVRTITGSGALVGAGSEVVGRQTSHDFATGNTSIWMLGPRGRVWRLENRDPYDAHKRGREVCS